MTVPPVTRERWQAGIDLERIDWDTLEWQRTHSRERRTSEWNRHLARLGLSLDSFGGREVLDVGCGPTGLVYFLDATRRVGLDALADQYEQWNGHWGDPIELVHSDAEEMPFGTASFDAVFCVNCLDHTRNPTQVLRELARVARPGAVLVLHVDIDSPLRRLHKRVRPHAGAMHPHSITYGWLRNNLVLAGFEIECEGRDPEVFRATRRQMRYEAYWDGLLHKVTGSDAWMNHVWLRAVRRSPR